MDVFISQFLEVCQSTLGLAGNFTSYNERGLSFLQMYPPGTINRHSLPSVVLESLARLEKLQSLVKISV